MSFGAAALTPAFGAPAPTAVTPAFGAPAPTAAPVAFGSGGLAPSGVSFGATAAPAFGAAAPAPAAFGAAAPAAPAFGAPATTAAPTAFGAAAPAAGGLFGGAATFSANAQLTMNNSTPVFGAPNGPASTRPAGFGFEGAKDFTTTPAQAFSAQVNPTPSFSMGNSKKSGGRKIRKAKRR